MKVTRTVTVAIVCAFVLALAPAALAQSPATLAYGGECSTPSLCTSSSIGSKSPKPTAATALPFTGINLLEVAAMGLVLAGAGVAMRRSRRPGND
jgi:hypothetical protein